MQAAAQLRTGKFAIFGHVNRTGPSRLSRVSRPGPSRSSSNISSLPLAPCNACRRCAATHSARASGAGPLERD